MAAQPTPHEHLLTPAQVAALVFVDPKTVSRWAQMGKLPAIRTPGGHRRFRRSDVEALMPQQRRPAEALVAESVAAFDRVRAAATARASAEAGSDDTARAADQVAQAVADATAHVAVVVAAFDRSVEQDSAATPQVARPGRVDRD